MSLTAQKTTAGEENENIVHDDKLDEDIGNDKLSSDQVCDANATNENTSSSTCTMQNPSAKTEKFYSVSARDRNIVSCSLGVQSSSASVVMVDIVVDDTVDGGPVTKTVAGCGDSPKRKQSPKPRPRFHRPSAPMMETSSGAGMTNDNHESEATYQRTGEVEVSSAQNNELRVNMSPVAVRRIKPPTLPKKTAILKLQKVDGSAGYGSDEGLSALTQVSGRCSGDVSTNKRNCDCLYVNQCACMRALLQCVCL